jgi:hypothetical protein
VSCGLWLLAGTICGCLSLPLQGALTRLSEVAGPFEFPSRPHGSPTLWMSVAQSGANVDLVLVTELFLTLPIFSAPAPFFSFCSFLPVGFLCRLPLQRVQVPFTRLPAVPPAVRRGSGILSSLFCESVPLSQSRGCPWANRATARTAPLAPAGRSSTKMRGLSPPQTIAPNGMEPSPDIHHARTPPTPLLRLHVFLSSILGQSH